MSLSAVSLFLALAPAQAQASDSAAWRAVQPSVIEILDGRSVSGVAALIDDSGLFLAHSSAVTGRQVRARFSDGRELSLLVLNEDEHTQLTLLKAMVWSGGVRRPLKVASQTPQKDVELLAVTIGGPKTGEFISGDKAGVMRPSLRYVPLSEVRMKSSTEHLGGAIVFDKDGNIVGVLGATLLEDAAKATESGNRISASGGFGGAATLRQFGPESVTVAYALGREVLQRVVKGFASPSHQVEHPTIGIFFKASPDGRGVLVDTVMASSPAGSAGIQPGDVIVEVDGTMVNNPVDLAALLFRKNVGDKIQIRYVRGLLRGTANMTVAGAQAPLGL